MKEIRKYLKQIDKIDSQILKLLRKRAEAVIKIGKSKKKNGKKVKDKKRERKISEKLEKEAEKQRLNKKFVHKLFGLIIKHSRKIQK